MADVYRVQKYTITELANAVRNIARKQQTFSPNKMITELQSIQDVNKVIFHTADRKNEKVYTISEADLYAIVDLLGEEGDFDWAYEDVVAVLGELLKSTSGNDFWDLYQQNGNRRFYAGAFFGSGWNEDTFHPKYDLNCTGYSVAYMFAYFNYQRSEPFDLEAKLEELGIGLYGFINSTTHMFQEANISVVPELDFSNAKSFDYLCNNSKIQTFRKIKVSASTKYTSNFTNCSELENITFEGTIGQNGLNFQWSKKLSKESITSIINCLSTTTTGLTITLSLTSVGLAFASEEGGNDGDESNEWNELVLSKPNWNISLV